MPIMFIKSIETHPGYQEHVIVKIIQLKIPFIRNVESLRNPYTHEFSYSSRTASSCLKNKNERTKTINGATFFTAIKVAKMCLVRQCIQMKMK